MATISDLYQDVLGRTGETAGMDYWKEKFGDTVDANEIQTFTNAAQAELNGRKMPPSPAAGLMGSGTINIQPAYTTGMTRDYSNAVGGVTDQVQDVYKDWYANPLTTGISPEMQGYFNKLSAPNTQWTDMATQAGQMSQQGAAYNPAEMQKHLNPYLNQATNDIYSAANRNLNENLMPNVNSTFTGAGQFGSTRNADFANRALRDTQEAAARAASQLQLQGWGQAATDYSTWGQMNQQAANNLGGLAKAGAGLDQQNLQNLGTAATGQQALQQQSLDATYQDWIKRQSFPMGGLQALAPAVNAGANAAGHNTFNLGNTSTTAQPDNISKIIAALQALTSQGGQQNIANVLGAFGGNT